MVNPLCYQLLKFVMYGTVKIYDIFPELFSNGLFAFVRGLVSMSTLFAKNTTYSPFCTKTTTIFNASPYLIQNFGYKWRNHYTLHID